MRAEGEGCGRTAKHPRLEPIRRSEVGRFRMEKIGVSRNHPHSAMENPKIMPKIDPILACAADTHIKFRHIGFQAFLQRATKSKELIASLHDFSICTWHRIIQGNKA